MVTGLFVLEHILTIVTAAWLKKEGEGEKSHFQLIQRGGADIVLYCLILSPSIQSIGCYYLPIYYITMIWTVI